MKNSITKTIKRFVLIALTLLILFCVGCDTVIARASGNNDKVVSILKESVPLSGPQPSEEAQAVFESGSLVSTLKAGSGTVTINRNLADKGIVGFCADISTEAKLKLKVSKDGNELYYNVTPSQTAKIPMQFGSGQYDVELYENMQGSTYRQLFSRELTIQMDDPDSVFLFSNMVVNYENKEMVSAMALVLTQYAQTESDKLQAIYDYVISHISYDYQKINNINTSYIPDVDEILASGKGICYDYSALMAAMLREARVPAKLIKGYRSDNTTYHAWNEVLIDGEWITIDATYDATARQNRQAYEMEKNPDLYLKEKEF
ncbi:MAG: transglutaminase-like domain-containing protein [Christensenellales bacterium]